MITARQLQNWRSQINLVLDQMEYQIGTGTGITTQRTTGAAMRPRKGRSNVLQHPSATRAAQARNRKTA